MRRGLKGLLWGLLGLFAVLCFWVFERDFPASGVDRQYSNEASAFLSLANGTRLHFRDQGNPAGPTIVLLHGSNSSLHTWGPWVNALGDGYRMVSLDLPGHGLTGRTPDDDYSTAAFISAVGALVEHLNLDTFVLAGNSMGGGVSWRYALTHPEQVSALVLVDASGPRQWRRADLDPSQDRSDTPLAFRLLQSPWFQSIAGYIDPYYLVVQGLKASHFEPSIVDDDLVKRYYNLSMREGTRAATIKRFSTMADAVKADASYDLGQVRQPSLILWGEHDTLIPVSYAYQFEQALPDAEVVVYADVGHIPMEEKPQVSARDVHTFLCARGIGPCALELGSAAW